MRVGEYDVSTTAEPLRHEEHQVLRIILHPQVFIEIVRVLLDNFMMFFILQA